MKKKLLHLTGLFCAVTPIFAPCAATADSATKASAAPATRSTDEIARELSHPASKLISFRNDFEFRSYGGNLPGAGDQNSWRYVFTPSVPIGLDSGRILLLRGTIPVNADQPLYRVGSTQYSEWMIRQYAEVLPRDREFVSGHDHLDDISLDMVYGGVSASGLIGMFGIKLVLPASQDFSSAREQWLLGPEVVFGKESDWGTIGFTASHVTDIASEDALGTNISALDVFFAWGLGNGWQLISNPKIEYDWEGASDNRLFLPLGGGISKTLRIGGTPLKIDAELYNYLERPEAFGPEWQFSLTLTPALGRP